MEIVKGQVPKNTSEIDDFLYIGSQKTLTYRLYLNLSRL